ncbi:MAG TPA: hypothetical protein PKC49_08560 [Phycisphaerae bacterium]|nr:hypothetical protein [Phycisphaerae bacterium]
MYRYRNSLVVPALSTLALAAFCALSLGGALPVGAAPAPAPSDNPFQGDWVGTFTTTLGGFGTIEFSVNAKGKIRGSLENLANGDVAEIIGHVNKSGFGHANTMNPPDISHPFDVEASFNDAGQLIVVAQSRVNEDLVVVNVLDPQ